MHSSNCLERHEKFFHAFFLLLLVVASAGRLYQLESPSLWYDEILLPISVSSPWAYFYEWFVRLEVHPPLPYLIVKGMLQVGTSDFALRLPFSLAGIASIYLVYRVVGRHFGVTAALASASFLAASPLHLYLSTVVRPYTFIVVAMIMLIHAILEFRSERQTQYIYWAAFFNSVIFSFHYIGIFIFIASAISFFLSCSNLQELRSVFIRFAVASILFSAPTLFFFIQTLQYRASGSFVSSLASYATRYYYSIINLIDFAAFPDRSYQPGKFLYKFIFPLLCLLGALSSIQRRDAYLKIWACYLFIPLCMIVFLRFNLQVTPWHISFLLPIFAILIGIGIDRLPWKRYAAYSTAFAAMWSIISFMQCGPCHEETAHGGTYKSMAKWVLPDHIGNNKVLIIEEMSFHSLNWYLNQHMTTNSLLQPTLTQDRTSTECTALTNSSFMLGHYFDGIKSLGKASSSPNVTQFSLWNAISWSIPAHTSHDVTTFPYTYTLTSDPNDLIANAHESKGLLFFPFWDRGWMASRNQSPGRMEFEFNTSGEISPKIISLDSRYHLKGQGNTLRAYYRFDDEDWLPILFFDSMPSASTRDDFPFANHAVSYQRLAPFRKLRVAFELNCSQITPRYDGGNLSNVVLNSFTLGIDRLTQNLFSFEGILDNRISLVGINGVERDGSKAWRWAMGPSSGLELDLPEDAPITMNFAFHNFIPGQGVSVIVNGQVVKQYNNISRSQWLENSITDAITFSGIKGRNTVIFTFDKWNGHPERYLSDAGTNSVAFTRLELNF